MKAMIAETAGGPEVLKMEWVPDPQIQGREVLLRVVATSVNPLDLKIRRGTVPVGPGFPGILQGDVAGVVVKVGPKAVNFRVGDEVMGFAGGVHGRPGALAQFMAADERFLVRKPPNVPWEQAAALPCAGISAYLALESLGLQRGQSLLILGATGGVGHLALQMARRWGYEVSAQVSTVQKAGRVRSLGVGRVFDVEEGRDFEDWVQETTEGRGFDGVLSTWGGQGIDWALKAAGWQAQVGLMDARWTVDLTNLHRKALNLHGIFIAQPLLTGQGLEPWRQALATVVEMAAESLVESVLTHRVYTLEEAALAHEVLEKEKPTGKVVIRVAEDHSS